MITDHTIIYLTMWSGWATAVATIGLAIFAFAAWRASAHNLHLLQIQLKTTEAVAASQIADQEWGRQVDALARYLRALLEIADATPILPVENYNHTGQVDSSISGGYLEAIKAIDKREALNAHLAREVETAGAIWRLLHHGDTDAVDELEYLEHETITAFHLVKSEWFEQHEFRESAALLIELVQEWQAKPASRADISRKANTRVRELRRRHAPNVHE